jgi:hypothetical protein
MAFHREMFVTRRLEAHIDDFALEQGRTIWWSVAVDRIDPCGDSDETRRQETIGRSREIARRRDDVMR